jgi:hypothetical protein
MAVNSASPIDIDIDSLTINFNTNTNIDIDTISTTLVGIAMPAAINTTSLATKVDVTGSTISDTASPSIAEFALALAIDLPATAVVKPVSSLMGTALGRTGGFDMAFGLFNFCIDNDRVAELISISDSTPPAADQITSPAIGDIPSMTTPLAPSEEEPRLETSTPLVGSNDF